MQQNFSSEQVSIALQDCFHDIANSLTIFSGALEDLDDADIYQKEMEYVRKVIEDYKKLFLLFFDNRDEKSTLMLPFLKKFLQEHFPSFDISFSGKCSQEYSPSFLLFLFKRILFLFSSSTQVFFKVSQTEKGLELEVSSEKRIVKDLFEEKLINFEKILLKHVVLLVSGSFYFSNSNEFQVLKITFPVSS